MIVYLTHDATDFARELRARFLAEGHSVYAGDALAALPAIDLFLATQDERLAGDDFSVLDGVDPEIVMRAVEENLCAPSWRWRLRCPRWTAGRASASAL